ncbi:MAG: hypothetical protein IIB56_10940 [Planctomycetes bacterium]|nr:hypothetical protein [Planctomycetota bacterium]
MGILTVNLKHLYQRRGLWLVYVCLGILVFVGIAAALDKPATGKGKFIIPVASALFVGFLSAALAAEVVNKPFSYCLPGHRKVPRKFIFSVGVVTNLLGSLVFLMYPGLHSWQRVLVICSAFFAGLVFYWIGVLSAFVVSTSAAWVGFLPWLIIGGGFFDLHITIERTIVENPLGVTLLGAFSSIAAWIWLGNANWARRYCGVPWIGLFDAWNRDKLRKYKQLRANIKWDKLKKHPNPWVERFFLGRMNKCDYIGQGRYIWGGLYTTYGIVLSQWKGVLSCVFIALLMLCFLCYMGSAATFMLFFMPGFMIMHMRTPLYSSIPVSGGRNERFYTTMTLVAATAVLITALVTIIAALTVALTAIMPNITLRGSTFTFHPAIITLFFVPLLIIPVGSTLQLIFYRRPIFMVLSVMLLFMLLFFIGNILRKPLNAAMANPVSIVTLLVLSWLIFVLVLRRICMRRCLVGQGRAY